MAGGGVGALRGLDGVMAGAQLFLLARGEKQRIVDARAEAEHPASGGSEAGRTSVAAAAHISAPKPSPRPANAAEQRVARGAQAAQHRDQQHDRDHEADHLADREAAGGAVGSPDIATPTHGFSSPAVASSSRSRAEASSFSGEVWS